MRISIKVLKGEECELEVTDSMTIYELKQKIERILNIPLAHQKLLCTGRTLVDDKTISSYGTSIKPGTKLTVVVKEPEPLKDIIYKVFKRYYNEDQSEEMAKEFMLDLEKRMNQLSLDDIERMAIYFLDRDRQLCGGGGGGDNHSSNINNHQQQQSSAE